MATLFAVGLPFTFNGTTSHFATTSGGTASVANPTSADTVTFDSLSGTGTCTFTANMSCASFTCSSANVTISPVAQTITCVNAWTFTAGTFTPGTSTVIVNAASATFAGSGKTYSTVNLTGGGSQFVTGANTFTNLTRTGPASTAGVVQFQANQTITGTLTLTGGSTQGVNRLLVNSNTAGIQRTLNLTGGAVVIGGDVDFVDTTITGSPTWTNTASNYIGDAGGNGGAITTNVTTPAAQTWSGNTTGSYSTAANWTSRVPLPQDPIIINGLTSGTITFDMPRVGAGVDFTGSTNGHVTLTINFSVYGSWTYVSTLVVTGNFQFTFAGRGSHTLTCAGIGPATSSNFAAPGGTYTLQDNFKFQNPAAGINFTGGTFDANGHDVITTGVNSFPGNVNMGSGTWTLTGTGIIWQSPTGTFNAQTSTIIISDTSTTAKTFSGNGQAYYNVIVKNTPDNITITGANTYRLLEYHAPLKINNYQQVSAGDGMSVGEKIR